MLQVPSGPLTCRLEYRNSEEKQSSAADAYAEDSSNAHGWGPNALLLKVAASPSGSLLLYFQKDIMKEEDAAAFEEEQLLLHMSHVEVLPWSPLWTAASTSCWDGPCSPGPRT